MSFSFHWRTKSLREALHQRVQEAWRLGQSEEGQCVKWSSHKDKTCSCSSSCSNISMLSSNTLSSSSLSLKLRIGTSVPLLALHSNGSHDKSIFFFVCLCCSFLLSSQSQSPKSFDCLNKNAAISRQLSITNLRYLFQ